MAISHPNETPITSGQEWLINVMKALGYPSSEKGVCRGAITMGMYDLFFRSPESFDTRLKSIHELWKEQEEKNDSKNNGTQTKLEILQSKINGWKTNNKPMNLSKEEANILAFFEGTELHHQPHLYADVLNQENLFQEHTMAVAPILTPKPATSNQRNRDQLKTEIVEAKKPFSGIYTESKEESELALYFSSLRKNINKKTSLALILSNSVHSLMVFYDRKKDEWRLVDINHLPSITLKSDAILAKMVMLSFEKPSSTATLFSTQIFTLNHDYGATKGILNAWEQSPEFKKIHEVTQKKEKYHTEWGTNLLFYALDTNDIPLYNILLNRGLDPNATIGPDEVKPLTLAIIKDLPDVIPSLLAKGANPWLKTSGGTNAFTLAEQANGKCLIKLREWMSQEIKTSIANLNPSSQLTEKVNKALQINTAKPSVEREKDYDFWQLIRDIAILYTENDSKHGFNSSKNKRILESLEASLTLYADGAKAHFVSASLIQTLIEERNAIKNAGTTGGPALFSKSPHLIKLDEIIKRYPIYATVANHLTAQQKPSTPAEKKDIKQMP